METLIVKTYRYKDVSSDPKFSLETAFCRLHGVLDVVRTTLPGSKTTIAVPTDEYADAQKTVRLNGNETLITVRQLLESADILNGSANILVFDEQGFFATPELVKKTISVAGDAGGTWNDIDKLLWGFNFSHACMFFIAPANLVKKHISIVENGLFSQLQETVLNEIVADYYDITPRDIQPVYKKALKYNPYPYHFYIEPTSKCNSKCIMCPFHSPDPAIAAGRVYVGTGGDTMSLETFKRLVDELASIGWRYLPSYRRPMVTAQLRGESTLAPDFDKMVAYVKERGLRLSFTTNGSALHRNNLAAHLVNIGADEVIISIDGDRAEFNKVRPQLDYDQVVENIRTLRRLRDEKGTGFPVLYTKRVHLRSSNNEADRLYIEKFAPMVDWAGIAFENYDDFRTEGKGFSEYFFDVEKAKRVPCIWASDVSVIKADGKVDLCFGGPGHIIGDIHKDSLLNILGTAALRRDVLAAHAEGNFGCTTYCNSCTSWKSQYNVAYEEEEYLVRKNPILAYWRQKEPQPVAVA